MCETQISLKSQFPYVESYHPNESDHHVKLKGLAVYWLLQNGFSLDDIEDEHSYKGQKAYTDIYAEKENVRVFIECETDWYGFNSLSFGGKEPAKDGEWVLLFKDDGVFEVSTQMKSYEDHRGDTRKRRAWELERLQQLPMLDFTAFKE